MLVFFKKRPICRQAVIPGLQGLAVVYYGRTSMPCK